MRRGFLQKIGVLILGGWLTLAALPDSLHLAAAQTQTNVDVRGNRRVDPETLRSYFHPGPGGRLDAAQIDDALKALYATGLFTDVRIDQAGGRIIVTVIEAPVIDRVAFEGNKRVKDEQLNAVIQSKPRGTFSRAMVQGDVQRIVEAYQHEGRYDVRVDPKVIELADNRVNLVFEINDGGKVTVKEIRFVGNKSFSAWRLREEIKTSQTNILSFLRGSDVYDPDRMEADRDLLRQFYLKHGFADVHVVAAQAELDPARKGFVITFTIDEGDVYRLGSVDVQSDVRAVDAGSLRPRLRTHAGDTFNAEAVQKTGEDLTIEMAKRGYAFARIRPRVDRDHAAHLINLVYLVEEGQRTYVERINIRGNGKTRDYVIRREFAIAEGDAYNQMLIDRAERRLKNLGYFKTVKIGNEPGSSPDRVVVNVDVQEQDTGIFNVSGGYSTMNGLIAEVSVGETNLLGTGQYAKASVTLGQYASGFDLAFVQPYFVGTGMSAGVDIFGKQTTASSYQSFDSQTYGASVKLTAPLNDDVSVQGRYSLYNQSISIDPTLFCSATNTAAGCLTGLPSLPIQQAAANGAQWVSSVGTTTTYDTRDNKKNPTSGIHAEVSQDLAGVGGDVKFLKTTADVRAYHEVAPDTVGMVRVGGGDVTGWGGQQVPLLNSFFGGPQFVRGFAPNGFGPRDLTLGSAQDNVGGNQYFVTSAELQSRIPYLPPEFGLKLAVFADAGSVWGYGGPTYFPSFNQSAQVADSTFIRSSVGMGLVWDSPVGPLRIDYALPITKTTYDVTQPFSFGLGAF
jgi:outer membrane protein insertion porin family